MSESVWLLLTLVKVVVAAKEWEGVMKIGWIGTGVMGASMAGYIQAAGHQLYVAVKAQGYGRSGIQALMLALKNSNGLQ